MASATRADQLTTTNPLRDAYDAYWTMLRSKIDFGLLFGETTCFRQISVNATAYWSSDNDVDHASLGAHPRVRVVARVVTPETERNSCGSLVTLSLETQIWTAAQQQALILDCLWAVIRGMLGWREYVQQIVTWNGKPCIVDVDAKAIEVDKPPLVGQSPASDKPHSKGYNQWIGIYKTEITFSFSSSDMQLS